MRRGWFPLWPVVCLSVLGGAEQADIQVGKVWVSPSVSNYGYLGNFEYPGGSLDHYIIEYSALLAYKVAGQQVVLFGGTLGQSELDYGFFRADGRREDWTRSGDGRSTLILGATADLSQLADPGPQQLTHTTVIRAYAHEKYDDFLLLTHQFTNLGNDTLRDFTFGYHLPADVGAGGVSTPELDDWTALDSADGLAYMYDDDGDNGLTPYYVGQALMEAPDPAGGLGNVQSWTGFSYYLMVEPIVGPADLLDRMTGGLWEDSPSPGPYSVISTVGPYTLDPEASVIFTVALVYGEGLDGLRENLSNARALRETNWIIPADEQPPQVPQLAEPQVSGRLVRLEWDSRAESAPDFFQYLLYRSTESAVGPWELLDSTITNSITDLDVRVGFPYFYTVRSEDSQGNRSGRWGALCRTLDPVRPLNDYSSTVGKVKVVPNPYLGGADWELEDYESSIFFTHLPISCTITIFALTGEEVIALPHNLSGDQTPDGSGDERWDLVSRNRQTIASGLYLYRVQTPQGEFQTGQFVIIKGAR